MKCFWSKMLMADARRRDLACERVSTKCQRTVPRAHDIRAIWKGRAAAGIYAGGLGQTEQDLSGDPGSFIVQAPRVRAAGSRNVGPERLRGHQRGLSWRGQITGPTRSELSCGVSRLLRRR